MFQAALVGKREGWKQERSPRSFLYAVATKKGVVGGFGPDWVVTVPIGSENLEQVGRVGLGG